MKDVLKLLQISAVFLLTIYILFPLVHEGGHILFALMAGGTLEEVRLFPVYGVLCGTQSLKPFEIIFIGSGGIISTFLFSVILEFKKSFCLWLLGVFFRLASAVSLGISLISLILRKFGAGIENEDAAVMLNIAPEIFFPLAAGLAVLLFFTLVMIKRDRLIKVISSEFSSCLFHPFKEEKKTKATEHDLRYF